MKMPENPNNLCCVDDYERVALTKLPKFAADYYCSGSCGEFTLNLNKTAFQRLRIRPRMLVDVSKRNHKCVILGNTISQPIGVSPSAMQKLAHADGECGNARAVGSFGSIYILSTLSTTSIEEVAKAAPNTIKWFQLYIYKDRNITRSLVNRAEKAGFKALVVTVDACVFGKRYGDVRNTFCLPPHLTLGNFEGLSESKVLETKSGSGLNEYVNSLFDDSITWRDIKWLKSITSMPIVLKGILTAEDAKIACDIGVAAIMVSNHGGRQLDTCPASIEALPEVVEAVAGKCEVYFDGGIRYGTDVFKAIAYGAKMVFVGRPALWGLACNGEEGVKSVLKILQNEFDVAMALAGCTNIGEISKEMVVHESVYSKY